MLQYVTYINVRLIVSDSYIFLKKIMKEVEVFESDADTHDSKSNAIGCLLRMSSLYAHENFAYVDKCVQCVM